MCRHISRETPYDRPHCRLRTLGTGPMETKAGTAMATPSIAPNASTREVENMTSISDEHDRLRCLWVSHWRLWRKLHARYDQEMEVWWDVPWPQCRLVPKPPPPSLPFPEELRDLACGARTRAGTACKRRDLYDSGRCKLHGGLSTGPRTKRGKRRSAKNGFKRHTRKRTP
jgi:hypothetical protein